MCYGFCMRVADEKGGMPPFLKMWQMRQRCEAAWHKSEKQLNPWAKLVLTM